MTFGFEVILLAGLFLNGQANVEKSSAQKKPAVILSSNKNGDAVGDILHSLILPKASVLDKPVILIARLGDGEKNRDLNRERMRRVKNYLGLMSPHFAKGLNIVIAEGERVAGQGSVEIYVDGVLTAILRSDRNRYLCATCCEGCVTVPAWARMRKK
jgi:hypothetical protein